MGISVALVACGVAAGTWLLWRLPTPPRLGDCSAGTAAAHTSIIIPARDEELMLPGLLRSLAAQGPRVKEIIVVDDGSTDRTAQLAMSAGATVIAAPIPPAGWTGKPWACQNGAQLASGELLMFLDADTEVGPNGLERLLAAHSAQGHAGLLSVQPFHRTVRAYEQLSAMCNVVSMMATGVFRAGRKPRRPVAFGPCLITTAVAYHQAGGHAAVSGEVIEDLYLARAFHRVGLPVCCLVGGSAISFRMYPVGLGQLIEGWTKNLSGGARLVSTLPMLGAVVWTTACIVVASAAIEELAQVATGGSARWWPLVAWVVVAGQLSWMLRRIGSFRWWTAVAFPLPLAAFVALFVRSLVVRSVRRRVRWRGRDIDVSPEGC